jgi:hypothetical protein
MSLVQWNNGMDGPPVVDNARSVPKKPVIWIGSIWLVLPTGEKLERSWRSNQPISRSQAQTVLAQLLDQIINEVGKDSAVDSGFWMRSR